MGMTMDELQNGYYWIFRKTYTLKNILKRSLRGGLKGIKYRLAMNFSYRKKALRMPEVADITPPVSGRFHGKFQRDS